MGPAGGGIIPPGTVRINPKGDSMSKEKDAPVVRLKRSGHQPTKAEMEEDVSIDATPEELARAVLTPVRIEYEDESA